MVRINTKNLNVTYSLNISIKMGGLYMKSSINFTIWKQISSHMLLHRTWICMVDYCWKLGWNDAWKKSEGHGAAHHVRPVLFSAWDCLVTCTRPMSCSTITPVNGPRDYIISHVSSHLHSYTTTSTLLWSLVHINCYSIIRSVMNSFLVICIHQSVKHSI